MYYYITFHSISTFTERDKFLHSPSILVTIKWSSSSTQLTQEFSRKGWKWKKKVTTSKNNIKINEVSLLKLNKSRTSEEEHYKSFFNKICSDNLQTPYPNNLPIWDFVCDFVWKTLRSEYWVSHSTSTGDGSRYLNSSRNLVTYSTSRSGVRYGNFYMTKVIRLSG